MLEKPASLGNLVGIRKNQQASGADLRTAGRGRQGALALRAPAAQASSGVFDALMAVNQAQNKVLSEVLDGPVSQQTQRQLATIQAMNMRVSQLDEAALSAGQVKPAEPAEPAAEPRRRRLALGAGRTVAAGVDVGRVFSPSQLSAFKQRNGLARVSQAALLENEPAEPAKTPAELAALADQAAEDLDKAAAPMSAGAAELSTRAPTRPAEASAAGLSDELEAVIKRVGEALGLEPSLIKAVIKTESNFDQKAVSSAGAKGLMQLMPKTAKEMGVADPFNPLENIWGGARYLKKMLDSQGGDLNRALAADNWGPGNFERRGAGGKSLPRETRNYIEVVNRNYRRFKSAETLTA
ncbi:MAG: lytic transglycosylase domain-containing protein [Deltaproteobacteria bacterium]|jgi:soluble lytic murein transglycosylase-like protein|nr:lytic transglycosylase domain-containing protein [Deltaproteobacteria bacterium]